MTQQHTTQLLQDLIDAPFIQALDARQRYLYEQTLHSLVRLAKSEQMLEIRRDVQKLTAVEYPSLLKQEVDGKK